MHENPSMLFLDDVNKKLENFFLPKRCWSCCKLWYIKLLLLLFSCCRHFFLSHSLGRFHQHFTSSFLVRSIFCSFFCKNLQFGFVFFSTKAARKILVKLTIGWFYQHLLIKSYYWRTAFGDQKHRNKARTLFIVYV